MVIYPHIVRALRGEEPYAVGLDSALDLTRVLDAIRRLGRYRRRSPQGGCMKTAKQIVAKARAMGVALPAFNIALLPMVEPVIRALRDQRPSAWWMVAHRLPEIRRAEPVRRGRGVPQARRSRARASTSTTCPSSTRTEARGLARVHRRGARLGYASVMVDGSRLALEENIAAARGRP